MDNGLIGGAKEDASAITDTGTLSLIHKMMTIYCKTQTVLCPAA